MASEVLSSCQQVLASSQKANFELEQVLQYLQSDNVTLNGVQQILNDNPQICEHAYGTKSFDLAGPGVLLSILIQLVCIILFGTLQSFISYILPPHAKRSTRLNVARFQVVLDTIFSISSFLFVVTAVTCFIRLRQDPKMFERIIIKGVINAHINTQTLAFISYIVQRTPNGVKPHKPRWTDGTVYLFGGPLFFITQYVRNVGDGQKFKALSRLCADTHTKEETPLGYPTVTTDFSGNYTLMVAVGWFVLVLAGIIAVNRIRNAFFAWVKKVFEARLTKVVLITFWSLCGLAATIGGLWDLLYVRQTMLQTGRFDWQWDFGQILVLAPWALVAYQLLLTCLICLSPNPPDPEDNSKGYVKAVKLVLLYVLYLLCKYKRPILVRESCSFSNSI